MTMTLYYCPNTAGFYSSAVNSKIPEGAVEITSAQHAALLAGQARGQRIEIGAKGQPQLVTPVVSREAAAEGLIRAVQAHLDTVARSYGYDAIATAVTYAEEPAVARFQAEGQAFRAWRSKVWDAAHGALAAKALPTESDLIAALPVFAAPDIVA